MNSGSAMNSLILWTVAVLWTDLSLHNLENKQVVPFPRVFVRKRI